MLRNYTITLTTQSPVFIGGGVTISKKDCYYNFDYKTKKTDIYILDGRKVYNNLYKLKLENDYLELVFIDVLKVYKNEKS